MNLQDASVVVHLDLPWNPARLAQRVGRVRRPGGAVVVHSYLMSPPAQSRLLLDVERRLRRKIEGAERAVGRGVAVVPWLSGESAGALACPRDAVVPDRPLSAEDRGEIAARVAAWARRRRAARGSFGPHCPPFIAAACGPSRSWLAMLSNGQMVAAVGGAAPDDDGSVLRAVVSMGASGRPTCELEVGDALRALEQWLRDEAVRRACGVDVPNTPLQVAVQRRTSEILTRAPRHERIRLAVLARQLRSALQRTRPLGAEWQLAAMLEAPVNGNADADWLMRACEIARRAPGTGTGDASDRCEVSVVVLICVARDDCERVLIASPEAVSQPLE
jgi:hypothetical protein